MSAPGWNVRSFICPHCGVLSQQIWYFTNWDGSERLERPDSRTRIGGSSNFTTLSRPIGFAQCANPDCQNSSVWVGRMMVYPLTTKAPKANGHMPAEILKLYNEAGGVMDRSPRAAGALLRLALELLCRQLTKTEDKDIKIDRMIGLLVAKGLNASIIKALDVVRVTGNDAVHPGVIDTDDPEVVGSLFGVLNFIVEQMIESPAHLDALHAKLPVNKLKGIEDRNARVLGEGEDAPSKAV